MQTTCAYKITVISQVMIPLYRVILIPLSDKVLNNLNNLKTFYIHQVSCQYIKPC